MEPPLLAGSLLGLGVALLYGALARRHAQLARGGRGVVAGLFALFWGGVSMHAAIESAWAIAVAAGVTSLPLGVAVLVLKIASGVTAIFALVAYLLGVYLGHTRFLPRLLLAYALVHGLMLYAYLSRVPLATEVRVWYAGLQYAQPEGALHLVVAVLLFAPPLAASVGYAWLARYAADRAQRRRILLTSFAFACFFGGFLLGWMHERWFWWGLTERLLPLAAGLALLRVSRPTPPAAAAEPARAA